MNRDERDEFVKAFAKEPRNLLILGPTGSGKTALLKMILEACDEHIVYPEEMEYYNAFQLADNWQNSHTMMQTLWKYAILVIDNAQVVQSHRNFDWIIDSRWKGCFSVTVIASTSAQFREMTAARLENYETIKLEKHKETSDDTLVS